MATLTVDLDEARRTEESRAKAVLAFINALCLPEGAPTAEQMEDLSRQIDEAIIRVNHDLARMESMK